MYSVSKTVSDGSTVPSFIIVSAPARRISVHVNDTCLSKYALRRGYTVWIGIVPVRGCRFPGVGQTKPWCQLGDRGSGVEIETVAVSSGRMTIITRQREARQLGVCKVQYWANSRSQRCPF